MDVIFEKNSTLTVTSGPNIESLAVAALMPEVGAEPVVEAIARNSIPTTDNPNGAIEIDNVSIKTNGIELSGANDIPSTESKLDSASQAGALDNMSDVKHEELSSSNDFPLAETDTTQLSTKPDQTTDSSVDVRILLSM